MTTPTGQISLNDVNVELGKSGTTTIALGNSDVRSLAGVASGAISMNNLRGVSGTVNISYTFSSNTADASLNLSAISGYSAGKSNITVTINSGVYLYATSTGSYGLNITGGTTGDTLTIVNNGYIMGKGGIGGSGANNKSPQGGENGGTAINFGFALSGATINNTNASAYIGGGGGGGGTNQFNGNITSGGGGAGGGNAYDTSTGNWSINGGGVGSSGGNSTNSATGAAGGRIFPGTGGNGFNSANTGNFASGGGTGGGGGGANQLKGSAARGGAGGSSNNAGSAGTTTGSNQVTASGGGGGWGASGGAGYSGNGGTVWAAGSGGKAVNLNGKSITWTSGNTTRVWGAVS